jgi:cyclic beta-1,2-glucan synthetase
MTTPVSVLKNPQAISPDWQDLEWFARGEQLARTSVIGPPVPLPAGDRRRRVQTLLSRAAAHQGDENAAAVLDNIRFLRSIERLAPALQEAARKLPSVDAGTGRPLTRVLELARWYFRHAGGFAESDFAAFLDGYQESAVLELRELHALSMALQVELLDRLATAPDAAAWPMLVLALQRVANANWRDLLQRANRIDRVLAEDPSGTYPGMDSESCDLYRSATEEIARNGSRSELEVARIALRLSQEAAARISNGSASEQREAHVGFYLVGRGRTRLESEAGYRAPWIIQLRRLLLKGPTEFYLISIELLTFLIVISMLSGVDSLTPIFAGLVLLLLPASQAAVDFVNNLVTSILPPRPLPKLDFSEGIPDSCITVVAVPALLLHEEQVHDLALDLEIRFLANRQPNLYFALLTDTPDSERPSDHREELVELCVRLVENLNERYQSDGRSPFLLLHRHRTYNQSEGRWMGWERKRGKLLDFNRALRGDLKAFPVRVGDVSVFPKVRYVLTLDADTQLPRDSAARLIGTLAHPLNRAVVDPHNQVVVEGYGILQPRIGISIQSASRSRLAGFYSGQTGFDIYTRAVSDVYQDLFAEGSFVGKGIYEVDVVRQTLEQRFPENALLSHDLIEGAYARAGLVSDIELIDDYPSHFSGYNRRKHRWVRGDWQILRWLLPRVPDISGRMGANPISVISQWKILDNLRRSLFEPSLLFLLIGSWLYLPGRPAYWTAASVAVLFLPALSRLFFALFRVPTSRHALGRWVRDTAVSFFRETAAAWFSLIFLLHQALILADAIIRSLVRVFVTRRKLLEWETAAEAEGAVRPKARVDTYLAWTPVIALALCAAVWFIRPRALPAAAPILSLWLISGAVSGWLNRRPRAAGCRLRAKDATLLCTAAERIYRYFSDWSSPGTSWLIPDSVRENGSVDLRISPTNLGFLLNARIAAVHLGLAPLPVFVFETRQTLDRVLALPKHRGHLFNWYSTSSLQPIEPLFVSTVDSGNLAASLWTLKQAALAFAAEPPAKRGVTKELAAELKVIAQTCQTLVREMDFRCLYHRGRRALSIGLDAATGQLSESCYDMLASEARIATFMAIAKGDAPQEAWFSLARVHTSVRGERVLISWTGTMFEYLMPALWMRQYPGTILEQSVKAAVRVQREYARRKGVPWGISESAHLGVTGGESKELHPHSAYSYAPFGISALAMRRSPEKLVIAPYATFLALPVDAMAAMANLRQMEEYDWNGRYGLYEAVEYTRAGGEVIRSWMAHHLGMSLMAIGNVLFDNPFQRYFHAEPQVIATELLLHERACYTAPAEPAAGWPEIAAAEA